MVKEVIAINRLMNTAGFGDGNVPCRIVPATC